MIIIKILKNCFGQSVSESVIKTSAIMGSFDLTYWCYIRTDNPDCPEWMSWGILYTRYENGCTMDFIYK